MAWETFLNTPSLPHYPSTHSVAGGAASAVLARFFGSDKVAFTMTSGRRSQGSRGHSATFRRLRRRMRTPGGGPLPLSDFAKRIQRIENKVRGLGFGADDYMTKPFHKDELVARIHAIVRRSKGHAQSVIQTGDAD